MIEPALKCFTSAGPGIAIVDPYPGETVSGKHTTVEGCKADCLAAGVAVCGALTMEHYYPPHTGSWCQLFTVAPGTSVRSACAYDHARDTYVIRGVWDGSATVRRRQLTATVAPPPRPPPPVSSRRLSLPPSMYGGNAPNGKCYMELDMDWKSARRATR